MFSTLMNGLNALSHGWSSLAFGYATVQGPMLTALVRSRAQLRKLLWSPALAVPVTLVAGMGTAAIQPVLRGLGVANGGLMQFAAGVGVCATVGYVSGRIVARHTRAEFAHRRGTLIDDSEAPERPRRTRASRGSEHESATTARGSEVSLSLGGRRVPAADETKHFKFIGTTGTGKSTAICEVLKGALDRGDRAIIADPDGGYLRRFYDERRGDVILNPFEPKAAKWDLYGEITNDYDISQLARSLIPDHEGSERSWRAYGRTFFSAVVKQTRDGGVKDVSELFRVLVTASTNEIKTLVAGTPAQPFLDEHNARMFDSIRSVTSSAVEALEYIGKQQGPSLSVRNWVNNGKGVLFIPYHAGQIASLRADLGLDASRHLRDHEPGRGRPSPVVRRGRVGCSRPDRWAQGCLGASAQVRWALCVGFPVDCASVGYLWSSRGADDCRKLRQHPDPAVRGQRKRGHVAIRFPAHRTARGRAHNRITFEARTAVAAVRDPFGAPQRGARRAGFRDRAAS